MNREQQEELRMVAVEEEGEETLRSASRNIKVFKINYFILFILILSFSMPRGVK